MSRRPKGYDECTRGMLAFHIMQNTWNNTNRRNHQAIDHFHYDVTHPKVSGSCSKDRAQGRSIAGKFKIIHKNTCNAMAAELVDHTYL